MSPRHKNVCETTNFFIRIMEKFQGPERGLAGQAQAFLRKNRELIYFNEIGTAYALKRKCRSDNFQFFRRNSTCRK